MDPSHQVIVYSGYFVNGYAFRSRDDDNLRETSHSGVCLRGNDAYYGVLSEVVELEYLGHDNKVVLFRCDWFDSVNGVCKHDTYNIMDVDTKSKHQGMMYLSRLVKQNKRTLHPTLILEVLLTLLVGIGQNGVLCGKLKQEGTLTSSTLLHRVFEAPRRWICVSKIMICPFLQQ
jgi:hypothetical protein